jgi:beta-ureidopropionase / N-carbamoyl-L-amino-acid hydrolase
MVVLKGRVWLVVRHENLDLAPTISASRLLSSIADLAAFGGRPDGGVDRVAGSSGDIASRAWLNRQLEESNLVAITDKFGNTFGYCEDSVAPKILTGSHTDSVPAGGRLDGAYGVMAALEVLRTLYETGHEAAAHLVVVDFWDEEGTRPDSGGGLVGSTNFCRSPSTLKDQTAAFIELHIEQGPRMERSGTDLAVVEGIVGVERYQVSVIGAANHAGTTPMLERSDAGRAAAKIISKIRDMVLDIDPTMVANVGYVSFSPGSPNVIPGEANLTVEWRSQSQISLERAIDDLRQIVSWASYSESCDFAIQILSKKPITYFDQELCELAERACGRTGGTVGRLVSYAGHDSSAVSEVVPTTMIFVPSVDGISHAPRENTKDTHLVLGCQALAEVLVAAYRACCS